MVNNFNMTAKTITYTNLNATFRKGVRTCNWRKLRFLDKALFRAAIGYAKYGKSYDEFSQTVPDTVKGHDDWIEWSYLVKVANVLSAKIEKLRLLLGK